MDLILPLRLRKALAIFFGVVEMLFFGGVIFGFNALIPVLQKEGIYSHLCGENATIGCSNQVAMYGYAFTTFMVAQMAMLFVVGFLVDHVGLRIVKICSSIIFSVGAVLFAVTTSDNSWLIFPSGSLMCVGGMANLICDFAYSKLFDKTSVFVLAFITGSYDAASSIFALVALGYDAGFSYKLIFYLLAGIGLAMNTFSSLFIVTYRLSDMSMFLPREHMNPIENGNKKVDEVSSINFNPKSIITISSTSNILSCEYSQSLLIIRRIYFSQLGFLLIITLQFKVNGAEVLKFILRYCVSILFCLLDIEIYL